MSFEEKISIIREELKKTLPGQTAQYLMAPEFRGNNIFSGISKKAAVMICIFPGKEDLEIVFFKRNDYDGPHGGQVSFPGGVFEVSDKNLAETAIRETREEIGLDCRNTSLIGKLTPLLIPVSNMNVQPFIGFYNTIPAFKIEKREVEYLIISPIGALLDPSSIDKQKWMLHGQEIEVPFYRVNGNIIWGATAMILSEFLAVISNSGLYPQFRYSGNDRSDT
jgi:8-oxo-dGTP pyrophosphatase MutT (NUDIX family)